MGNYMDKQELWEFLAVGACRVLKLEDQRLDQAGWSDISVCAVLTMVMVRMLIRCHIVALIWMGRCRKVGHSE